MMSLPDDRRLYVPHADQWTVRIKPSFDREYCHAKSPGEDHYHLLLGGEIHLDNGEQKYCLNCALRMGLVTLDRTYWRKGRDESDIRLIEPLE
jgi:hypothetical protein